MGVVLKGQLNLIVAVRGSRARSDVWESFFCFGDFDLVAGGVEEGLDYSILDVLIEAEVDDFFWAVEESSFCDRLHVFVCGEKGVGTIAFGKILKDSFEQHLIKRVIFPFRWQSFYKSRKIRKD